MKATLVIPLLAVLLIAAEHPPQRLLPGNNDADLDHPPNNCLPAAMKVYAQLPKAPVCKWKRILSAKRPGMNHVYCVFKLGDQVYVYDPTFGSRPVRPSSLDPSSVAKAVDPFATGGTYFDTD